MRSVNWGMQRTDSKTIPITEDISLLWPYIVRMLEWQGSSLMWNYNSKAADVVIEEMADVTELKSNEPFFVRWQCQFITRCKCEWRQDWFRRHGCRHRSTCFQELVWTTMLSIFIKPWPFDFSYVCRHQPITKLFWHWLSLSRAQLWCAPFTHLQLHSLRVGNHMDALK